jgi:asparagine synthase (glutamine-hydrolysing)
VPPGHMVKISREGVRRTRFWSPVQRTEIRYKTDAEYEEHFRNVFRESVRCRLRAQSPVWAELSGGFDSSSIVVVADDLLKEGSTSTRVDTVSYVFDQSPMSNELSYLQGVEDQRGRAGYHILESECPILAPLAPDMAVGGPSYLLCFARRHRRLCGAMHEADARVLLCGHGGDNVMWSQPDVSYELADHLSAGRLLTLHRRTLAWSRALSRPYTSVFTNGALAPNLSPGLRRQLEQRAASRNLFGSRLLDRRPPTSLVEAWPSRLRPSRREQLRLLRIATSISAACYYRELGGIDVTYPFLDRRVVEFLLAIPFDQIVRPGMNRSLHRRAMAALLPDSVTRRRGKRAFDEAFYRGLVREAPAWRSILADPYVCRRGWVNRGDLHSEFELALRGGARQIYVLMKILALEMWLRQLHGQTFASHDRDERHTAVV